MKKTKHMFTKQEAKSLFTLWNTNSKEEIAEKLGLTLDQVSYLAGQMKLTGFKLSRKHQKGHLRVMLTELKNEMNIK